MEHAISIVVPVRNDRVALARLLDVLRGFDGDRPEIIVVDGASTDDTIAIASRRADVVLSTAPGRGRQLRAGVLHASGDLIWMLHADTAVSSEAWNALCAAERRGAALRRQLARGPAEARKVGGPLALLRHPYRRVRGRARGWERGGPGRTRAR